ncbi:RagB/SusD family nutrient uptake outer membrane protein [Pedobacter nyackensis]|uniref:RagB/SusD family nutrient uptake outer membrane protein n=1 Tax=Pedobacter nyackensis TaxID=475255 RepID=UPI00292FD8CE|nr:RagB/SusD family nutrient uptake outer membrane protein [Pedobacter nyackensis]
MNNIRFMSVVVMVLTLTTFTSCKKWLTVEPKTSIQLNDLLTTETGFRQALVGIYTTMNSASSYGQALSMTTIEHLIANWDVTNGSLEQKLTQGNYLDADVQTQMLAIYKQQYNIIANINAILDQIDQNKAIFKTPGLYEIVKGECLALRAYCHFDVMRIWGPVPTSSTGGKLPPYVTSFSTQSNPLISFTQFQNMLIKDLTEAEFLLKGVDPILTSSLKSLSSGEDNPFNYRHLKMNYYAVKALQARAYLWFGSTKEAYESASSVISAKDPDGNFKFRLGTSADFGQKDNELSAEQVFGLHNSNLNTVYNNTFANGILKRGTTATTVTNQLYGATGTDIRETKLWLLVPQLSGRNAYVIQKYNVPAATNLSDFNRIPMLRLSEIYFIAIETATNLSDAQVLWNNFRAARGLAPNTLSNDPVLVKNALLAEYRKEFFAEGQAFYAYKRLNTPTASMVPKWTPATYNVNYLFPLPNTELQP